MGAAAVVRRVSPRGRDEAHFSMLLSRDFRALVVALALGAWLPACGARVLLRAGADGGVIDDAPTSDTTPIFDAPPRDVPVFPDRAPPPDLPPPPDRPPPVDVFDEFSPPPDVPLPDVPPPPVDVPVVTNLTCATATPLPPGLVVSDQDISRATLAPPVCPEAPWATGVPVLWYRASVPTGNTLTVTTASMGARLVNLGVRVYTACGASMCLAGPGTSPDGRTNIVRWTNAGGAREVFIAVGALMNDPTTRFSIVANLTPAPSNLTCDRATELRDGLTLVSQDVSAASERQGPCPGMPGAATPVLFYTATVPPGQTLAVSATPTGSPAIPGVLRVMPDCALSSCLAVSATAGTPAATVVWNNPSTAPQRVVVTLGAQTTSPTFTPVYTVAARISAPAANASCDRAVRVVDGTTLPAEDLSVARAPNPACDPMGAAGPVLYYVARVGAGQQLGVAATRVDGAFFTPMLRILDGCMSTTCLGTSAGVITPTGTRASWINDGEARDVIVMLSSSSAMTGTGRASVSFRVAAPPFTVTRVATACDDMTGATPLGISGDDVGSPSYPLPFVFPYFAASMTAWSASSNGFLQVWPSTGMSTGALNVAELPNSSAPPNAIAPFWDDLYLYSDSQVRSRSFTAAPQRFVVEWSSTGFCCGAVPDRITFQVKLFSTGAIEYHYCARSGTARTSGSNASIGLQDSIGSRGVSWSIRRMDAVDTTRALRFTPAM